MKKIRQSQPASRVEASRKRTGYKTSSLPEGNVVI